MSTGAQPGAGRERVGGGGALDAGTLLHDRYEIRREIGRGGMSVVYEARDRELDATVAVKLLVPPPAAAEVARERMRREVQAVRTLRHPSIVRVFDVLEDGHWTFVIMEHVDGSDLQTHVAARGPLPAEQAARIGAAIAGALGFAHHHGVLHRDVKPHNLLLDANGDALLADFGSARIEGQATLTRTGGTVGTLAYMAPEVLAGQRADARSDVYALGMTLHYALSGALPDAGPQGLPAAPAEDGYSPAAADAGVPAWLDVVVRRATRADPCLRFQTAASLAEALSAAPDAGVACTTTEARPGRCLLCREPEPFGLALCPRCAKTATSAADRYVVPLPLEGRDDLRGRIEALAPLARAASAAPLREVALGRKPLIRVHAGGCDAVLAELSRRGVEARAVPLAQPWRLVPRSFKALVLGVLACGWLAPIPGLWLGMLGSFTAVAMGAGALRLAGRPLIDPEDQPTLSAELDTRAVEAMRELAPGVARSLLADIVFLGRDGLRALAQEPVLAQHVSSLMRVGLDAARELDGLDRALERLSEQRGRLPRVPDGWLEALARCERARDGLVQRLLEASAALGMARSSAGGALDAIAEQLAELTRELEAEAELQADAAKEVATLVDVAVPGR